MKLTPVQREVLLALINLYQTSKGEAIKGENIAVLVKKNPGTIRNQMQSLRSLGLVEGVPGPRGGYRPTTEGYKILSFEKFEKEVQIPIFVNDYPQEGLTVTAINFVSTSDPGKCRAEIHAIGNLKNLAVGDAVKIGPTPVNKLVIKGKITGRDDIDNVLLIETSEMFSIPRVRVVEVATKTLKILSPKISVREAAKLLVKERIRGAPVVENHKPVGILSTVDIAKALAENKEDCKVEDIMSKNVYTINENDFISSAIEEMENYNVSRLIAVDDAGNSKGIITTTDILCRIASLCRSLYP
jgi:hypothetical protein